MRSLRVGGHAPTLCCYEEWLRCTIVSLQGGIHFPDRNSALLLGDSAYMQERRRVFCAVGSELIREAWEFAVFFPEFGKNLRRAVRASLQPPPYESSPEARSVPVPRPWRTAFAASAQFADPSALEFRAHVIQRTSVRNRPAPAPARPSNGSGR